MTTPTATRPDFEPAPEPRANSARPESDSPARLPINPDPTVAPELDRKSVV